MRDDIQEQAPFPKLVMKILTKDTMSLRRPPEGDLMLLTQRGCSHLYISISEKYPPGHEEPHLKAVFIGCHWQVD